MFPVIGTEAYWLAIKAGQFGPGAALYGLFQIFDPPEERPA